MALYLNKLESPPLKDVLSSLDENSPMVKRFLNIFNIILHGLLLSPLGERRGLSLNEYESISSKDALCNVW